MLSFPALSERKTKHNLIVNPYVAIGLWVYALHDADDYKAEEVEEKEEMEEN